MKPRRNPSLSVMEAFARKTQERLTKIGERHDYCSIRWESTAYPTNQKNKFEVNWGGDNRVLNFPVWNDLTAYVEMMLEKRENARPRT